MRKLPSSPPTAFFHSTDSKGCWHGLEDALGTMRCTRPAADLMRLTLPMLWAQMVQGLPGGAPLVDVETGL
jgi:hypothetical protein